MSNFEEEPVNAIRESSRWLINTKRRAFREENADHIRRLSIPRTSSEKVLEIINKLKTKCFIRADELNLLKNELLNSDTYVRILLTTHGALRGLVRELTGKDIKKQCESAGCLCNISLGDGPSCVVVAKMAGSYLVTTLDSASAELKSTSAWALGNLFGSGRKVCELLQSQGVANKLLAMLTSCDQNVSGAALYAVTHYLINMLNSISVDPVLESLLHLPLEETNRLIFMLSCNKEFTTIILKNNSIFNKLANLIQAEYQNKLLNKNTMYVVRISANMCSNKENCDNFLNLISFEVIYNFLKAMQNFSKNVDLVNSVNWFLGNILVYSNDSEMKTCFFNQIIMDFGENVK